MSSFFVYLVLLLQHIHKLITDSWIWPIKVSRCWLVSITLQVGHIGTHNWDVCREVIRYSFLLTWLFVLYSGHLASVITVLAIRWTSGKFCWSHACLIYWWNSYSIHCSHSELLLTDAWSSIGVMWTLQCVWNVAPDELSFTYKELSCCTELHCVICHAYVHCVAS